MLNQVKSLLLRRELDDPHSGLLENATAVMQSSSLPYFQVLEFSLNIIIGHGYPYRIIDIPPPARLKITV